MLKIKNILKVKLFLLFNTSGIDSLSIPDVDNNSSIPFKIVNGTLESLKLHCIINKIPENNFNNGIKIQEYKSIYKILETVNEIMKITSMGASVIVEKLY
jgi:hypothetical protein